jgi:hydrogenase nickel incorporation protein HypA/HybF
VRVRCTRCGTESPAHANRLICPACGDFRTQLLSGDELLLAQVELALPGESHPSGPPEDRPPETC